MDTIITIVLVVATLCLLAISVYLIIELYKDMVECRKAVKRREELIKKWKDMKLDKPCIYIDTDAEYYAGYTQSTCHTWSNMRTACRHFSNISSVNRCIYPDNDSVQHCNYSTCPLLHARIDNG